MANDTEPKPGVLGFLGGGKEGAAGEATGWQRLSIILAVALVTVALGWFGLRQERWNVVNMADFRVCPAQVDLTGIAWLDGEAFRKDLLSRDKNKVLGKSYSILEKDLAKRVAQAYEQSPWVRHVRVVNKEFPNRLRIQLELRKPFAAIELAGRPVLVDQEGVVLDPKIFHMPANGMGQPPVKLAYLAPQPQIGAAWKQADTGVAMALEMLEYMAEKKEVFQRLGVRAVEVRREGLLPGQRRDLVVLKTVSGADIWWGGSPYNQVAGASAEVAPGVKLRRLDAVLNNPTEGLAIFEYIDVRWDRPTAKKRATSAA